LYHRDHQPRRAGSRREVVEQADRYSPLIAGIARPVPVRCDVRITAPLKE
jgi:hypothetical protein